MRIALGIGCDRGTPADTLRAAVEAALNNASATWADVAAVGSVTLKSDEAGLLALAAEQGWTLVFHPPEVLAEVPVPNPSETVRRYTGTPSVSEAAALLGAGPGVSMDALVVEKLRLRGPDGRNATVSVARCVERERNAPASAHPLEEPSPKIVMTSSEPTSTAGASTLPAAGVTKPPPLGKIMLVGIGPGHVEHMTARARAAIAEADVVVGYVTYIKLVADLLEGKEVQRKGMTEELDRAVSALEAARAGKKVALISSGDAGVYGMAGPTYEVLFQAGWTPEDDVEVEIVPGASALNSCASLVGAPLTHDFCAISLSDLLTPWPVIARRLDAVAYGDFVVALYNPKSGRRTRQIVEAQRLFLRHRRPDTPVAIVKSAFRRRQHIEFTTLDRMSEHDIGMLSTVLIGNSSTFVRHGLMVTPRGYANKYDADQGFEARDGEKAGRSLSSGLLGWLEGLQADHAAGVGVEELAQRHHLPVDYVRATLEEPLAPAAADAPEESDA